MGAVVSDVRGSKGRRYYDGIGLLDLEDPQQTLVGAPSVGSRVG
jgi:hypothetical protein